MTATVTDFQTFIALQAVPGNAFNDFDAYNALIIDIIAGVSSESTVIALFLESLGIDQAKFTALTLEERQWLAYLVKVIRIGDAAKPSAYHKLREHCLNGNNDDCPIETLKSYLSKLKYVHDQLISHR